jgi:hypothetical protein
LLCKRPLQQPCPVDSAINPVSASARDPSPTISAIRGP